VCHDRPGTLTVRPASGVKTVVPAPCGGSRCACADRAAAPPPPPSQRALFWAHDIARMFIREGIEKRAKKGCATSSDKETSKDFDAAVACECDLRKDFTTVFPASSTTPARQRRESPAPARAARGLLARRLSVLFDQLAPQVAAVIVQLAGVDSLDIFGVSEAALIHTFSGGEAGAWLWLVLVWHTAFCMWGATAGP
jgi:hypothetical protein